MPNMYNLHLVKKVANLYKEFQTKKDVTPAEFAEEKLGADDHLTSEEVELFLMMMKHIQFFDKMAKDFWKVYDLKPANKHYVILLMLLLIFKLNNETYNDLKNIFTELDYNHSESLLEYFLTESNLVSFALIGVSVFSNDYVLENMLNPIVSKSKLLEKLVGAVKDANEAKIIPKKLLTVPRGPSCLSRKRNSTKAPCPTPELLDTEFYATELPPTTYQQDRALERSLATAYNNNRYKAYQLLERAKKEQFNCAKVEPKRSKPRELERIEIKPKPLPPKKDVQIKMNATTLMRQAALLAKTQEDEIKKLEHLCSGGFDDSKFDHMEEDMRKENERNHIQEIERKHLQGMLTYEEAILAKKNLLKANQDKMEKFREERLDILREIDLWREDEELKIRAQVEKIQAIEKNAREAEKKLLEEKRGNAKLVDDTSKKLLREAYQKREEDLARKVQLIRELRALHQIRSTYVKKFDPTESPNFGFMCEMSIAELQERLLLLKLSMRDELEEKKTAIAKTRTKQTEMMKNVRRFIDECKTNAEKPKPKTPVKLEETPDIMALRQKLKNARSLRINEVISSSFML